MPKYELLEIEKAGILNRIIRRFGLRFSKLFSTNVVQLVTSFDEILKDYEVKRFDDITRLHVSGNGYEVVLTVPKGKRYHIKAGRVARTGGDMTVESLFVHDTASSTDRARVYYQAAAIELNIPLREQDLTLSEGMSLSVYLTAVAADSTFSVVFYMSSEDEF